MRKFRSWVVRLAGLFNRRRRDRELADEIESHLQIHTEENLRLGLSADEARRQAVLKLGGVESTREAVRDQRGLPWLETILSDLKYGLRMLFKTPAFTAIVFLTLALGIGGTVAIYTILNAVILNPVPVSEPDRFFEIGERSHGNKDEFHFGGVNSETLEILQSKTDFFAQVIWYSGFALERKTADFIDDIGGFAVSANFFEPWQIAPLLGRTFSENEAVPIDRRSFPTQASPIVLGYTAWRSKFGGDEQILGKTFVANNQQFTVIGVMPPHFQFPYGKRPAFWIPARNPPLEERHANNHFFARLNPGVTPGQTKAMLDTIVAQLLAENPSLYGGEWRQRGGGFGILMRPLRHFFTKMPSGMADLQRTFLGLQVAVGFVLLIVCVNVGTLLLARTEKRQQELAVRAAIGAGRSRILRQLLTESILLAFLGAAGGIFVAFLGIKALILVIPEWVPRLREIQIDGSALAWTLTLCLGSAMLFGLTPAWLASRASVGAVLKQAGLGATVSAGWKRYRSTLIIVEIAVSLVLLTGAGLMLLTVSRLLRVDPGFDAENVVFAHLGILRDPEYYSARDEKKVALIERLQQEFRALPGVQAVGVWKIDFADVGYLIEGSIDPIALDQAGSGVGDSDLFRAIGAPLLSGRYFENGDVGENVGTVIINQAMARLCWPGKNPLHKKFRDRYARIYEVIGVAPDLRRNAYAGEVEPTFFRPYHETAGGAGLGPFFAVRTQGNPGQFVPQLRDLIKKVETRMTRPWFQSAGQELYESTQVQRTYMLYLIIFAALGLLLSALGIYGTLAYSVTRRTRELGIRIALGAGRVHVLRLVMSEGVRLIGIGVIAGLLAAASLAHLMAKQLFEISATDPLAFTVAAFLLLAVALLACLLPAYRATQIAPTVALRYE